MSETDGMDNPAFTIEEDCAASAKVHDGQQQVTLDQDHKPASEGGPMENGHQRSFVSQQYVEPGRTSPDPRYKTETRIELPESNERTVVEPKLNGNGVHGNGNNNDASFLNSSATSVQMNGEDSLGVVFIFLLFSHREVGLNILVNRAGGTEWVL